MKNTNPQSAEVNRSNLTPVASALLGKRELLEEYKLPRDVSGRLLKLLPHVTMGRTGLGLRLCVQRRDLERFLEQAARERLDLVAFTRDTTVAEFAAWFEDGLERVAA
jgi:hypothetical protein